MGSWLKRWRTWIVRSLYQWFLNPQVNAVWFGYEKAGVTIYDEPIPWNADTVLVEFLLQFPEGAGARTDFRLGLPRDVIVTEVRLQPAEGGQHRVHFRVTPPRKAITVGLYWRGRPIGQVELPYLTADQFLRNLSLEHPTTFAQLGGYEVACRAVVEDQSPHLTASALLKSPTTLLPLVDLGLALDLVCEGSTRIQRTPVYLAGSQLSAHQALLNAAVRPWPGSVGVWYLRWTVAERPLAHNQVRVISRQAFRQRLYLPGCLYRGGNPRAAELAPLATHPEDLNGPTSCVGLACQEPGLAALCTLEVRVHFGEGERSSELLKKEVLVTDVPSTAAPATIVVQDFQMANGIEVFSDGQFLGAISRRPVPVATFTSEGGFRQAEDFDWNVFAEQQLEEQLGKLMDVPSGLTVPVEMHVTCRNAR